MKLDVVPAGSLFQTEMFRDSPIPAEYDRRVGDVFVTTDPEYPGHFGAYFGYMLNPDRAKYPNAYIRDLRVMHDLTHIAYWKEAPFPRNGSFAQWTKLMMDAEVYASLVTECFVYFRLPELRGETFKHAIWVDRFLGAHAGGTARLTPMLEYHIAAARLRAMTTPDPTDIIEIGISQYLKQNRDWCVVWGKPMDTNPDPMLERRPAAFRVVEDHMRLVNEYGARERLEGHRKWLEMWTLDGEMPFPQQAREFRPIYEATGRESGTYLLGR